MVVVVLDSDIDSGVELVSGLVVDWDPDLDVELVSGLVVDWDPDLDAGLVFGWAVGLVVELVFGLVADLVVYYWDLVVYNWDSAQVVVVAEDTAVVEHRLAHLGSDKLAAAKLALWASSPRAGGCTLYS